MPSLNRFFSAAAIGLVLFSLFLSPGFAMAAAEIIAPPEVVRVGIYDNKPKIYRDTDGIVKGFFADILNYTAEKENWKIDYVYGTWEEGLDRLAKNEIDIFVDVAFSEDREKNYDFNNETALFSWGVIYTRPGVAIESIYDLEGKNIAVMKSGILFTGPWGIKNLLESLRVKANFTDVTVYDDVFSLLDEKQVDAGVVNTFYGYANEKDYQVTRTNIVFNPSELRFALTKDDPHNPYLIEKLDANLKELKENKDNIYQKHMQDFLTAIEADQKVETFPRWAQISLLTGAGIIIAFIVITLIARRYQAKLEETVEKRTAELKKSEEKYRTTVERANDGLIIIQNNVIKYGNPAVSRLRGEPLENIVGQNFTKFIAPEEIPKVAARYQKRLAGEKVAADYETVLLKKDGQKIPVFLNAAIGDFEGRPADIVIIHDMSEQKKTEAKVKELNELRKKFVQIVSHQLRTPLTSIRWSTESLLGGDMGKLEPNQEHVLRSLDRAEGTIISRLGDLLTVMEIEEGRTAMSFETSSLESLWGSAMKDIKKRCQAKKINFHYQPPDQLLPKASLDLEKIRLVFNQLVGNAIDYTPSGGQIKTRLFQKDNQIRFEVADSGIGIPAVEQPRIFTKFFRASNAASREPDRSGIGLAIAKFYIEQHGGKIGFTSEEGRGSIFWFEIPPAA